MADYQNVPRILAPVISSGLAKLHELDTVYSVQDAWWLLEIVIVDNHNKRIAGASDGGIGN
ncbi:hypothetical protein CIW60_12825 [Enterobacter roggenkampii]|nr:hypothetical protein [Enterobacter roggenkampii]PAO09889.1 hypothetical protein CIW60_12825 [Enterobacter roggenkampii]